MTITNRLVPSFSFFVIILGILLLSGFAFVVDSEAFTVEVSDNDGNPISGFRWMVEEDTTYQHVPGVQTIDALMVGIHGSYAPVVASGHSGTSTAVVALPSDTPYFISILPDNNKTLSGTGVKVGQLSASVIVNTIPVPPAQISVLVFHDNQPLNGAHDIPAEETLAGFTIIISDMAGQVTLDISGNPLGTSYNPDGSVAVMGDMSITTDANGLVLIRNLPPGKYGVQAIPPAGMDWQQTATIEGTHTIDAWVRADEPRYFMEWGYADTHAFIGFTHTLTVSGGTGSISGQALYAHSTRPPSFAFSNPGTPIPHAWIALNNLSGSDETVHAQKCADDGSFSIDGVPAGTYQMVLFDAFLDVLIAYRTVTVGDGESVDLGPVLAPGWFGRLTGSVFNDRNQDGFMDPGEAGILNQAVLLRRVDGTIYKETTTNIAGDFSFIEIFPFRHWLVMEVDFARYKATGATFIVDDGGPLSPGEINVPQIQPGGDPFRTELGPVITEGILSYATTTSEAYFGKANYIGAENGGISGIIHYATTRAENDPAYAGAEPWEPGIPRVQVNLYMDADYDGIIDDLNNSGFPTVADVDNYPFDNFPGPEDEDHDQSGTFDPGDAVSITWSDSWDDNLPTGCVIPAPQIVHGQVIPSCAETWQTFNQIRPAVWDGGYAFDSYYPGGIFTGSTETSPIPMGVYIVEAATPPFFEDVKEEDKNVDFGEEYYPHVLSLPPPCVGELHTVPDELTFFPGVDAPYAGDPRPLCDKKQLTLSPGQNAAADFFMFTPVPKAARVKGLITDDINLATDPDSVNFGEKFGTAWVPVAFRDFNGNELVRTYADEWGGYEALIPSTFTNNRPSPSGMSPNMLQVCINDFGPIPDPANPGVMIEDPYADTRWSTICYNFDFLPGKITTLDTPLIQNAAFPTASATLDCNYPDGSPQIYRVDGPGGGPWADGVGTQITIQSVGTMQVPNPDYNPQDPGSEPRLINRDYSFGATPGRVTLSNIDLQVDNWTASSITATITPNLPGRQFHGQLLVHRGDNGLSSTLGVTMTVGEGPVVHVPAGSSIQSAIDSAVSGSILLIEPGTYKESIILYKKLRLQGYGAFSTTIVSSISFPKEANEWQARFQALIDSGDVDVIGGQLPRFGIEGNMIPPVLTVATSDGEFGQADNARIDGLTISRSYNTAILVNAYAYNLEISNNRIRQNQGGFAGGIRIGSPSLINDAGDGFLSNFNHNIRIHNNHIAENAGISGSGGISIFNGSDGYRINDNRICGNYTMLYGGGIAHFGLSDEGVIQANEIIFNESTDEGAGVIIAGELPIGGSGLSPGSGSVILNANLIQGNLAWDDGGGIRTLMTNGQDVSNNPDEQGLWYLIRIYNNIIVNNSSSDSGGGISMDDSARITISQNTIAHNDSTSSGIDAFGNCNPAIPPDQFCPGSVTADSVPKVAGISSNAHSSALRGAFGAGLEQTYSNPGLFNNIIWQNRTFWWDSTYYGGQGGLRPDVGIGEPATYWDLAVEGTLTPERLNPRYSILTDTANYHQTNQSLDPQFVFSYFNIYEAIASVEWGYVHPTFTPISPIGDYHLTLGSPAIDAGLEPLSNDPLGHKDFDWEVRPLNLYDMGADEFYPTAAPVALPHDVDADDEDYGFPEIETEETSLGCGGR